ncbi:MAG: response regulator [Ignavibacteria bacterium]|nr:response regulator [Ignavibacteria bacterium]
MQENTDTRPKILYVEDQEDSANLVVIILKKNYNVIKAYTAAEAEEKIKSENFKLIIVDIALQDKFDGLDLVKRLKSDDAYKHIPIIALTAHAMHGDRERFLADGADDYVSKPFNRVNLIEKITKFVPVN